MDLTNGVFRNYSLIGVIGEGTYGVVYKARNVEETPPASSATAASRFYAVKVIKKPSGEEERRRPMITSISTLREAKLLRELSHPHVVAMTEVLLDAAK